MAEPGGVEEPLSIGSVLDQRYRIDGIIGDGGMARVYRALHLERGQPVVVKVLHASRNHDREAVLRFEREAKMARELAHPNIVTGIDAGILQDGRRFLVMEAFDGETFAAWLARERAIPWRIAVSLIREVLFGLQCAHERGIAHRDIKPENLFLLRRDPPRVKILDFGAAKPFSGPPNMEITQRGATIGAPLYMSPEQATGGEITPASDLYSTTVVLFEMVTGEPPFVRTTALQTMRAHVFARAPRLCDAAPSLELPEELEEIVRRGLAKLPMRRIRTADAYVAALDDLVAAHPE